MKHSLNSRSAYRTTVFGCDVVKSGRYLPQFRVKALPPYSGQKSEDRGNMFLRYIILSRVCGDYIRQVLD
jgi:hypothetical protein